VLNKPTIDRTKKIVRASQYDNLVRETLIIIWYAANKICSKRLAPFLPEFIGVLETHGRLTLSIETKRKLLSSRI
jgi:hypothetical protein